MRLLDRLVETPATFHLLRKVAEFNYGATKRRIRELLETDGMTLDLGCGTGEFSTLFKPDRYLGIDVSSAYLHFARRRLPAYPYALAYGQALPLADGSVRQVLINGVLHHLDDALAMALVAEAARVLVPDGRLLLIEDIVPAKQGLLTRLLQAMDAGDHIRGAAQYPSLLGQELEVVHTDQYRSGLCHYGLWMMRRR